mmetsp:Transcript_11745/g.47417  ORF Transcript_11745/g.47417 Transcript_11745/m.47417 type:complete len:231 (-) Transcript_11745:589-1281(-)
MFGMSLLLNVLTCVCRRRWRSLMTCAGALLVSCVSRARLALTMSPSLCVRSSSLLPVAPVPDMTEGRTGGGGMGMTRTIIHSGREYLGSRPSSSQMSSEMLASFFITSSAESSIFFSTTSSASSENSAKTDMPRRTILGRICSQLVCSSFTSSACSSRSSSVHFLRADALGSARVQTFLFLQRSATALSLFVGSRIWRAIMRRGSFFEIRKAWQWKQTQRRTSSTVERKP